MPKFEVGNMWEAFDKADRFVVLCSSTVTSNGSAVMCAGMAAELVARFPDAGLPAAVGAYIKSHGGDHGVYGFTKGKSKVAMLQDRARHKDPSDLMHIGSGLRMLRDDALENPDLQYHVEMPGEGSPYFLVKGPIELCPDNVTFWSKP